MNFKTIFAIFTIIAVTVAGLLSYNFYKTVTTPLSPYEPQIVVEIKKGDNVKKISTLLYKKGLIEDPLAFDLLAKFKGEVYNLKAGEYKLSPAMSPSEILMAIANGRVMQHPVTIPEGHNIYEIGGILERHNLTKKDNFVALAFNPETLKKLNFNASSLEGYLFPETYYFEKDISDYDILKKMTDTFRDKVMSPEIMEDVEKTHLSFHEVITLASLIEKETGKEEERSLISAVFYNRLKRNMRLQCDPTVIYAIKDFDGNLRKKDLKLDSPYNTYRYAGLPPGPIANPGLNSVKTALHPANVDYIYFVSKKNGEHKFSSTLKEHNKAVLKYQLRR